MPVLILHGEKDMMPVEASQEYADLLPKGKIQIMPGATHFPFIENPAEFAKFVREFLIKK